MFRLSRPPVWARLTLAVLVPANVGLFTFMALQPPIEDPSAGHASVAASTSTPASTATITPTPAATSTATERPSTPLIAVYGDGYTAGSAAGGQGPAGWPTLLAEELDADVDVEAVSMTGYEALGLTGHDFADLVSSAPSPDATVTVVFGSRNDLQNPAPTVGEAAAETFARVRSEAPRTQLVVVGPTWSNADVPAELVAQRDEIEAAAQLAGAAFVDPIAEGWFADPAGLIADDGVSPTDAGHRFMARALEPAVREALARR